MREVNLFQDSTGSWITTSDLLALLDKVGAADARVLYIHSGISFGKPDLGLRRHDLLAILYDVVTSLGVPAICVPTFTFSFCNGQNYNVQTSASKMGAFNEYIRRLPGALRSVDPLMSNAIIGNNPELLLPEGKNSVGEGSTFDKLHQLGSGVKFLFLGTTVSECFTYTHYVEERLGSPYRYNRAFTGTITDGNKTWEDTYNLFVRYKGVRPSTVGSLELDLLERRLLRKVPCGDSSISCVGESDAWDTIMEHLRRDALAYIAEDPGDRDTTFSADNMVAL